jgi:hypothetical protein
MQRHDATDHPRPAPAEIFGDVAVGHHPPRRDPFDNVENGIHEIRIKHLPSMPNPVADRD